MVSASRVAGVAVSMLLPLAAAADGTKATLHIIDAVYGHLPEARLTIGLTELIKRKCDGKQGCDVPVVAGLFGVNPAWNLPRQLAVTYSCDPDHVKVTIQDETKTLQLACPASETKKAATTTVPSVSGEFKCADTEIAQVAKGDGSVSVSCATKK